MKILIVTPFLPWPLDSGGNVAQYSTLKCLAADHEFKLVAPIYGNQPDYSKVLEAEFPGVQIRLVRCSERTERNYGAVGLVRFGMRLFDRCSQWLGLQKSEAPFDPIQLIPEPFVKALEEEIRSGVDLIQVEFAEFLSLASWLPKNIASLFVHHQLHFIYTQRALAVHCDSDYGSFVTDFIRTKEIALLRRFDSIITFSESDREILQNEEPMPSIYCSPFPAPADIGFVAEPAECFSGYFCFFGTEGHYPNRDGLNWLLEEMWPDVIRRLPGAKLKILGNWSDKWKVKASRFGGSVQFCGFVPDLGKAIYGGIQLVPLRIGSGIRTKILAALAQGVPCVATTVGAEGIEAGNNGGIAIADTVDLFVSTSVLLATDKELWRRHAQAGLASVKKLHDPESVRSTRNSIYQKIVKDRQRTESILGN